MHVLAGDLARLKLVSLKACPGFFADAVCAPTAMELQARTLVPSTSAINVASPKPSEAVSVVELDC